MENRVHSSKSGDTFSKKNRRGLTRGELRFRKLSEGMFSMLYWLREKFWVISCCFFVNQDTGWTVSINDFERRTFSEIRCVFLSNALFRMRHLRVGVSVASVTRFSGFEAPLPAVCRMYAEASPLASRPSQRSSRSPLGLRMSSALFLLTVLRFPTLCFLGFSYLYFF